MKGLKNIAIIPARGGSKRLPGKNIMPLMGKPLLEYSIDYAKDNLDVLHEIVVSTDDASIKELALANGIKVIDRPEELSGDTVPTVDVLTHTMHQLDEHFDNIVLLQVTNPMRPESLLKNALKALIDGGHDSLMTVSRNEQKLGKIVNGEFVPFNYEIGQRSQDLEPLYFENGLLYISHRSLINNGSIVGENMLPFIVDHPFANIDIDEQVDMDLATFFLEWQKKEQLGKNEK